MILLQLKIWLQTSLLHVSHNWISSIRSYFYRLIFLHNRRCDMPPRGPIRPLWDPHKPFYAGNWCRNTFPRISPVHICHIKYRTQLERIWSAEIATYPPLIKRLFSCLVSLHTVCFPTRCDEVNWVVSLEVRGDWYKECSILVMSLLLSFVSTITAHVHWSERSLLPSTCDTPLNCFFLEGVARQNMRTRLTTFRILCVCAIP